MSGDRSSPVSRLLSEVSICFECGRASGRHRLPGKTSCVCNIYIPNGRKTSPIQPCNYSQSQSRNLSSGATSAHFQHLVHQRLSHGTMQPTVRFLEPLPRTTHEASARLAQLDAIGRLYSSVLSLHKERERLLKAEAESTLLPVASAPLPVEAMPATSLQLREALRRDGCHLSTGCSLLRPLPADGMADNEDVLARLAQIDAAINALSVIAAAEAAASPQGPASASTTLVAAGPVAAVPASFLVHLASDAELGAPLASPTRVAAASSRTTAPVPRPRPCRWARRSCGRTSRCRRASGCARDTTRPPPPPAPGSPPPPSPPPPRHSACACLWAHWARSARPGCSTATCFTCPSARRRHRFS